MYRVVIADDVPEYLSWLRAMFKDSPEFEVVGEAADGVEAIELVETLSPSLVVADIDMPGMDGLDVARLIGEKWPVIKVVLISSHADSSYERFAKEEGALAFITKSRFSPDALKQALQEAE